MYVEVYFCGFGCCFEGGCVVWVLDDGIFVVLWVVEEDLDDGCVVCCGFCDWVFLVDVCIDGEFIYGFIVESVIDGCVCWLLLGFSSMIC